MSEKTVHTRSAKEFEVKEKTEEWTEQKSDRRKREEKWQTCRCCVDQQSACRMMQASAEKLEQTGFAEKEIVVSVSRESSWSVCQSRLCRKEKEQIRLSRAPDREREENQGEQ